METRPSSRMAATAPLVCGVAYLLSACIGLSLSRDTDGIAALWAPNGFLLAALIAAPRGRWIGYVLACAVASVTANLCFGETLANAAIFSAASVAVPVLATHLIRRTGGTAALFESPREIGRFMAALGLAAALGAALAAIPLALGGADFAEAWLSWFSSDVLGAIIVGSLMLTGVRDIQARGGGISGARWLSGLRPIVLLAGGTIAVFAQSTFPLLFVPLGLALLVTFQLGLFGAVVATGLIAVIGTLFTADGLGPVALIGGSMTLKIRFFQFYLAVTYAMSLPVAALLVERARLSRAQADSDRRYRRILDRSQEVIYETDLPGRWTYLNPVWHRLIGRDPAESLGTSFLSVIVPEDRPAALERLAALHAQQVEECRQELRYIGADGGVRWAAVRSHLLFDEDGVPVGTHGSFHDITAAKIAEEARVETQKLYRLLADNSNDMVVRLSISGVRLYVSPASHSLLGFHPDELIGDSPAGAIHPDDRAAAVATCMMLLDGVDNPICTYRQLHRDGHYVWLEASYRLIRDDESGEPVEFIASVRDVGGRQQAELDRAAAAAKVNEQNRLMLMAETIARIGHWRVDLASRTLFWSDVVCAIHGVPPGYPCGIDDSWRFCHPDDREAAERSIRAAMASGGDYETLARLIRPDGEVRHIVTRGQVEMGPDGKPVGLFGVLQDVTDAHEAEVALRSAGERFRLITEQAGDMISVHDFDGCCRFMSPAACSILGYEAKSLLGHRAIELLSLDERRRLLAYRGPLRRAELGTSITVRFRMRHADGHVVWIEAALRQAQYDDRVCLIAVSRDVTAQVGAEEQLQAARREAESAATTKSQFLANMSHEIRTPMNGVLGFTELLLASDLSEEQRHQAQLIADSGRAMMHLLNDILDLSKVEAGQMTVVSEPFDLAHALRGCGKLIAPTAIGKGLSFACELAPDLPSHVMGDALRLRQIVLNLLGNAAKFTATGGVTLRADVVGIGGDQRLEISVEDTGIGIEGERLAAIFDPFVQADTGIAARFGGTGLGLAVSAQLARLMGGSLAVASEPGRGSRFTLTLPLHVADRADAATSNLAAMPAARPSSGVRVLVAEDHSVNQLLITALLAKLGCAVDIAADGVEAVARVEDAGRAGVPYHLVLMDVQMPNMDGLTATARIRAAGIDAAALPIVALTANAYADDIAACLAAGMQAHLGKPVKLAALEAALTRWARVPAVRDAA